jgi:hypothetical protein
LVQLNNKLERFKLERFTEAGANLGSLWECSVYAFALERFELRG